VNIHGILNLDKPEGPTSFQIVARVRRATGVQRVGHGGTLDPLASGVLPVFLGQATRLVEFLGRSPKVYRARVRFGTATDTYDAAGTTTFVGDPSGVSPEQVQAALVVFRGPILQRPPPYSALKVGGRRLYSLARAGEPMEVPARPVEVFRLEMLGWEPPVAILEVECGKGTYIRSLAHDLGQQLLCGAHLEALERTRVGPFTLEEATSLSEMEHAFQAGAWAGLVHPMDRVVDWMRPVWVTPDAAQQLGCGQDVSLPPGDEAQRDGEWRRAYLESGELAALLQFRADTGLWHPVKVFIPSN